MIFSPLEQFSIVKILPLSLIFLDFSLTSISVFSLLFLLFFFTFYHYIQDKGFTYFHSWHFIFISLFNLILKLIIDNIGPSGLLYFNLVLSIFILILTLNYISLIPYSFTLTAHLAVALTLSISI